MYGQVQNKLHSSENVRLQSLNFLLVTGDNHKCNIFISFTLQRYVVMICGVVQFGREKLQRALPFYYDSLMQIFV
jgi:hypothetical protein